MSQVSKPTSCDAALTQQGAPNQSVTTLRVQLPVGEQAPSDRATAAAEQQQMSWARDEAIIWLRRELTTTQEQLAQMTAACARQQTALNQLINTLPAEPPTRAQAPP